MWLYGGIKYIFHHSLLCKTHLSELRVFTYAIQGDVWRYFFMLMYCKYLIQELFLSVKKTFGNSRNICRSSYEGYFD